MEQVNSKATFVAGEDLSGDDYKLVMVTGDNEVGLCDGTQAAIGVLYTGLVAGKSVPVVIDGVTEVIVGQAGGLAAGAEFACGATGLAITPGYEDYVVGTIIKGAAQNGRAEVRFSGLTYKTAAE